MSVKEIITEETRQRLIKNRMIYDYVFKKVLKSKTSKGEYILKGFLEVFLKIKVDSLELLDTEIESVSSIGKNIRMDIFAKVNGNLNVNVEMQIAGLIENFGDRLFYYGFSALSQQDLRDRDYSEIVPLVQLAFMGSKKLIGDQWINLMRNGDKNWLNILTDKWKTVMIELGEVDTNVQVYCTLTDEEQYSLFMDEYSPETTDER